MSILFISGCSQYKIDLKEENFIFEYGENIPSFSQFYLKDTTKDKILNKIEFKLSNNENNVNLNYETKNDNIQTINKNYLDVGEYKFYLIYDEKDIIEIPVVVKDTTAPSIKEDYKQITIEQNAVGVDFTQFFTCDDLSTCKIITDDSNVDISKVGKYTLTVSAVDEYDNKTSKDVEVDVVTLKDAREKDVITPTLDGKIYQSKELVEVIEKEKNAPKDTSIKKHIIKFNKGHYYTNNFNYKYTKTMVDKLASGITSFNIYYDNEDDKWEIINSHFELIRRYLPTETNDNPILLAKQDNGFIINEIVNFEEFNKEFYKHYNIDKNYEKYLTNVLSSLNLNTSDVNLVQQINDYIVKNYKYQINDNSIYSFTQTKIGKCWHYAILFRDLCNAVGIECKYIEGYGYGEYHAWNKVKINNEWYYIDVTWNDSHNSNDFFLTKKLWQSHKLK